MRKISSDNFSRTLPIKTSTESKDFYQTKCWKVWLRAWAHRWWLGLSSSHTVSRLYQRSLHFRLAENVRHSLLLRFPQLRLTLVIRKVRPKGKRFMFWQMSFFFCFCGSEHTKDSGATELETCATKPMYKGFLNSIAGLRLLLSNERIVRGSGRVLEQCSFEYGYYLEKVQCGNEHCQYFTCENACKELSQYGQLQCGLKRCQ